MTNNNIGLTDVEMQKLLSVFYSQPNIDKDYFPW